MASINVHIHPAANIRFGKFEEIAGNIVRVGINSDPSGNGGQIEPLALAMTDPDGEAHIYLFTEEGKQNLLKQLTGGVIVP